MEHEDVVGKRANMILGEIDKVRFISFYRESSRGQFFKDLYYSMFCGGTIEFFITACPDYSYDGNNRFDFLSLGERPGLVATSIFDALLDCIKVLDRERIHTRVTFAYAGQEAQDPDIQYALGLSAEIIDSRIKKSIISMYHYAKEQLSLHCSPFYVSVDAVSMTDLVYFEGYDFNSIGVDSKLFEGIKISRLNILSRWYERCSGRNSEDFQEFVERRCISDVTQHFALGETIRILRQRGRLASIVTMSLQSLCKIFNYSGKNPLVPILCVEQGY